MNLFRKPEVASLSEWLEIATRKLVEPSRERIGREVEAHYTEAVEGHCEAGLSESAAKAEALAELGDPKAAGRRFRKEHFTEREYRALKNWRKSARTWLVLSYLWFVNIALQSIRHGHGPVFLGLEFLFFIALPTATSFALANRTERINRHLLLVDAGYIVGFFLKILVEREDLFDDCFLLIWGLAILILFATRLRIWIKLGRAALLPDNAAPPNSVET